jgi:hypothetical protein
MLPLRITEFNFPGQRSKYYGQRGVRLSEEEEQAQAKALADYYRICFAQPAVEGILMWGFWEGANWIPVSSLYRRDWSPTPAADAYRNLVFKEWWTTWRGKANAQGRCEVRAFYGRHRITAGAGVVVVNERHRRTTQAVSPYATASSPWDDCFGRSSAEYPRHCVGIHEVRRVRGCPLCSRGWKWRNMCRRATRRLRC